MRNKESTGTIYRSRSQYHANFNSQNHERLKDANVFRTIYKCFVRCARFVARLPLCVCSVLKSRSFTLRSSDDRRSTSTNRIVVRFLYTRIHTGGDRAAQAKQQIFSKIHAVIRSIETARISYECTLVI